MKRKVLRFSGIIAVVAFVAVFYGMAIKTTPDSTAVKATDFKAGRIIDDEVFYNKDTMTVAQIQEHLDKYSPSCDMWGTGAVGGGRYINGKYIDPSTTRADYARKKMAAGSTRYHEPPYVCVNLYYENPTTHETLYETKGIVKEGMISAAQIIYDAAQKYSINPQVLLVMLKKESYVWGDNWPLKDEYNSVMGYACPDGAACDAKYTGFYNQVNMAAWQLNYYKEHINSYNYHPYMTNTIYYSPNYSCGTKSVYLENIATTSLYIYTPYTPNDAALANYPGTATCGAYGNRNFFMYFSEWFGSTWYKYQQYYSALINYTIPDFLGKSVGDIECSNDIKDKEMCSQKYDNGMVFNSADGSFYVYGGIYNEYLLFGQSKLGIPTSNEKNAAVDGYRVQVFSNGYIYWNKETGSTTVFGGMYDKYASVGAENGVLGLPLATEKKDSAGNTYQEFEKGRIYWNLAKGSWIIND